MEPDVKTLLTQKIRDAEREPVSWNKTAVWNKVQHRISTRSNRPVYYYVAAGVAFLVLGALFVWKQNHFIPAEHTSLKEASKEMPVVQDHLHDEIEVKESETVNTIPIRKQVPFEKTYLVRIEELPVQLPAQEEEVIHLEEVAEEPLVALTTPEEIIQPIVGVVMETEYAQLINAKTKRKKLRMLKSLEKTGDEPANNLLLARIK